MKPAHLFSIVAQVLALGAGLSSAQAAVPSGSLIVNGSFEAPVIAGSFQLFSSIPGWGPTGSCGNIEIDRNAFGAAADGKQSVELNTTCVNGVSQELRRRPAPRTRWPSPSRPGRAPPRRRTRWRSASTAWSSTSSVRGRPLRGSQWSPHQYEVTATGSSATLSFQGTDPTASHGAGTELDFVSLVPLVLRADPFTEIPGSHFPRPIVCPSPSVCILTGFGPTTLTVITDGIPGPTQVIPDVDLTSLACASPTSCFAVGRSNEEEGVLLPITNGVAGPLQAVPGTSSSMTLPAPARRLVSRPASLGDFPADHRRRRTDHRRHRRTASARAQRRGALGRGVPQRDLVFRNREDRRQPGSSRGRYQ